MISRRKASLKNAINTFAAQMVKLLGQFIVQTVFIHSLGAMYLGANGLFNNIVSFLSFAELGIGSSFAYALYKPLAEEDHETIVAILGLFRKVYNIIGLVILILGSLLSFFIPMLATGANISNLRLYFFLYLLSTVVSYFFTYNRSLLISDQKGYIDARNQLIFSILRYVLQLVFLLIFKSYFGYLLVQIVGNLLANLTITKTVRKKYPYLESKQKLNVPDSITGEIKKNTVGTISSKIGLIVVTGTDNILISKFVSLLAVGFYSNYSLIINAITTLLNQVLNSVVASFGNLGVTEKNNIKKQLNLFNQFVFYDAFVTFFISLVAFGVFQDFIYIWLGSKYQLALNTLVFIILNFELALFRPALYLVNAYGLFWGYRIKSIVEAIVNFCLSFYLVKYTSMGIDGVLLGTIIGNIFVNSWWDPLILFSGAYKTGIGKFYLKYWMYNLVFLAGLFVELLINKKIAGNNIDFGTFIVKTLFISIAVLLYLLLCFCKTSGEKDLFSELGLFVNKIFKK